MFDLTIENECRIYFVRNIKNIQNKKGKGIENATVYDEI